MEDNLVIVLLSIAAAVLLFLLLRSVTPEKPRRDPRPRGRSKDRPGRARTKAREGSPKAASKEEEEALPSVRVAEDEKLELTKLSLPTYDVLDEETTDSAATSYDPVVPIVFDNEADVDEPTRREAFLLVSAAGHTDVGRRRRRNEDSLIIIDDPPTFVVADGMGGYAGGDVASELAVTAVSDAFVNASFDPTQFSQLPRRGAEVVQAIQRANRAVHDKAQDDPDLAKMGTTMVCARFSPFKQRVYIGHVGDSRAYVLRDETLHQITTDHTAANEEGIPGPLGATLTRALGISPNVMIDLILGKPRIGDRYLLCSDGLSKMLDLDAMRSLLLKHDDPEEAVNALIDTANERGGRDNVTAILIRVDPVASGAR